MPLRQTVIDGRRLWIKSYPAAGRRRISLGLLDRIARRFGLQALRPPPHRGGTEARALEARRLRELGALGVRVPQVVAEDAASLRITDLGESLSSRLRALGDDDAERDALTCAAIAAIVDAHRKGAYFGQPVPRNMTVGADGIGFIDFEEDPLEVMSLEQAQARDWVLFTFGMMKHYGDRPDVLAALLDAAFREEPEDVGRNVQVVGERLSGLARLARRLGASARTFAQSVAVIARLGRR